LIEFTPRFLKVLPKLEESGAFALAQLRRSSADQRVDNARPGSSGTTSNASAPLFGEIHPITKIEVWKSNAWVDLD
jgi:hypothetical protein